MADCEVCEEDLTNEEGLACTVCPEGMLLYEDECIYNCDGWVSEDLCCCYDCEYPCETCISATQCTSC
jgi:hypothetical protein